MKIKECVAIKISEERNIVTLDDESLVSLEFFKTEVKPEVGKKYRLVVSSANQIQAITLMNKSNTLAGAAATDSAVGRIVTGCGVWE